MDQELKGTFVCFVQRDREWKANIKRINESQFHIWPSRWSFIVDEYKKLYQALAGKRPLSPFDWVANARRPLEDKIAEMRRQAEQIYLPPIAEMPPPTTIPKTSAGWYGYTPKTKGQCVVTQRQKWTKARPEVVQHDLVKVFKWPLDHWD